MNKKFNYLDGVVTVETFNGKTRATITDADGNTEELTEYVQPGGLTEAQTKAISQRFGEPQESGQPF